MKKKIKTLANIKFIPNIHKFYIVIALFFGIIYSVFLPILNGPDSQIHFLTSAAIFNKVPDLSHYGIYSITSSMTPEKSFYQSGTAFKEFFIQQVKIISASKIPIGPGQNSIVSHGLDFSFFSHIVPAFGLLLGYYIYPSLGMMVIWGRIFSMLVYSTIIYVLLKKVKAGKLVLFTISLSPLVLSQISSFSYDASTFTVIFLFLCIVINFLYDKQITTKKVLFLFLGSISVILFAKENYVVLLTLVPISFVYVYFASRRVSRRKKRTAATKRNILRSRLTFSIGLLSLLLLASVSINYGGILSLVGRFVDVFTIYNPQNLGVLSYFTQTSTIDNALPNWLASIWFGLILFITFFGNEKYLSDNKLGKFTSFFALFLFLLNYIIVYFIFLIDTVPQVKSNLLSVNLVPGVQGRYFTPLFLLLSIYSAGSSLDFKIKNQNWLYIFTIVVIIFSAGLFFINSYKVLLYT